MTGSALACILSTEFRNLSDNSFYFQRCLFQIHLFSIYFCFVVSCYFWINGVSLFTPSNILNILMCNPCCAVLSFRPHLGFHPLMVRVERLSPLNVFWMLVWAMFWKGWSVCFSLLLNPPLHQVVLWCLPPATQRPPACKTRSYAGHLQQPHRTICAHLLWVSSPGSMVHVLVLRLWRSPSTPHSSPLPQALHR